MPIQLKQIMQTLMSQLQTKSPQKFQTVNALMQSNGNPQAMIQQIMAQATPEQKQNLLNQAKGYGVPDTILAQIQNIK